MYKIFLFLHVLGAIGLGYYLILPLLLRNITKISGQALDSYLSGLLGTSRIAQYLLVIQLITGGYLMSKNDYSIAWIISSIGFFLVAAAISGIMNKSIKTTIKDIQAGGSGEAQLSSIRLFSIIVSLSMIIVIYFMVYPMYR
ncbi:MAG: hypothetical protein WDZ91_04460 [Paenibacillaceae bacterium]